MTRSRVHRGGERTWVVVGQDGAVSYVDSLSAVDAVLVVDLSRRTGAAPSVHAWVECEVSPDPVPPDGECECVRATYRAGDPAFMSGSTRLAQGPWECAEFTGSGSLFLLTRRPSRFSLPE